MIARPRGPLGRPADRRLKPTRPNRPPGAGLITVCVQRRARGDWEVVIPGRRGGLVCEMLDDARRIAYLSVAQAHDCELIVRDAYNRVLEREVISGRAARSGTPPAAAP
jgi:hypothetical protein